MYSHIVKGYNVGHTLTRRLGRFIFGLPGMFVDYCIVAPLWHDYSAYWKDAYIDYLDGVRVGVCQGLIGYIGDFIGVVLGAVIGSIIGIILYIPDCILRGLFFLYRELTQLVDNFAALVGRSALLRTESYNNPQSFWQKTWNVCLGTVGLIAGGILWAIARPFETILPFLGHGISNALWEVGTTLVTFLVSVVIGFFIYPTAYLCNNVADFYDAFRDKVRSLVALIYAKADSSLYNYNAHHRECECIPSNTVHSPEFRAKVQEYKPMTWAQLLCGELANAPHQTPDVEEVPLLSQEDNDSKKQADGNKDQQPNLRKESRDGAQLIPEPAKQESGSGRNSSVTDTQPSYLNASCVLSNGFANKKRLQELEQHQQTQTPIQEEKQTRQEESSEEIRPSC